MHVFFSFGGVLLGLFAKGRFPFLFNCLFLQNSSVRGYEQWNLQVQSIVFLFLILILTAYLCQNQFHISYFERRAYV